MPEDTAHEIADEHEIAHEQFMAEGFFVDRPEEALNWLRSGGTGKTALPTDTGTQLLLRLDAEHCLHAIGSLFFSFERFFDEEAKAVKLAGRSRSQANHGAFPTTTKDMASQTVKMAEAVNEEVRVAIMRVINRCKDVL